MRSLSKYITAIPSFSFLTADSVFAAGIDPPIPYPYNLPGIIRPAMKFPFNVALLVCPIFIVRDGMEIAASGGAPQKIAKGKRQISRPGYYCPGRRFIKIIQNALGTD